MEICGPKNTASLDFTFTEQPRSRRQQSAPIAAERNCGALQISASEALRCVGAPVGGMRQHCTWSPVCSRTIRRVILLACATRAAAMVFHSSAVADQWDTWAFVENGTFYAFYLVLREGTWFADSFGVASSADGTHFKDHGVVFTGRCMVPPCGTRPWTGGFWMGSGSVWRAADGRYVINWSQERGGTENISFAVSSDLIRWQGVDEIYSPDPRYYETHAPNGIRWDGIYTIPATPSPSLRDGYPRLGYWTATPLGCGPTGLCNHTMGFGVTHDGLSWNAWPSPAMQPPVVHWSEVGAVEYVPIINDSSGGRYFALLGGNPSNQVAEMIVYVAERPQGPFIAARKNRVLLPAARSCYFTRFFRGPGMALLVTHQSFSHVGRTYIAPYKAAHVDAEGTMRLAWWEGNQNLKAVPELPATITPAGWFMPPVDVDVGAIFEASFALPALRCTAAPVARVPARAGGRRRDPGGARLVRPLRRRQRELSGRADSPCDRAHLGP